MSALPENQSQNIGFLGRAADMLTDTVNQNAKIGMNFAMDNFNVMMAGESTLPYIINDNLSGAQEFIFNRYPRTSTPSHRDTIITNMTDGLLTDQFANLLELSHSTARRNAIDAALEYNAAIQSVDLKTDDALGFGPWPTHGIGRDIRQVARSIIARNALQQERQLFFVSRGGYDTHSNLIGNQATLLSEIGEAVYRFWKEMEAQGLQDCVTLFSASDFERTYGPNSNKGTDHAWAPTTPGLRISLSLVAVRSTAAMLWVSSPTQPIQTISARAAYTAPTAVAGSSPATVLMNTWLN
jgi:hypothetical protein